MSEDLTENTAEPTDSSVTTEATIAAVPASILDSLPDDLRSDPVLESFKDKGLEDIARSLVSSQRMLGGRIPIPSKGANKELRDEFFGKLAGIDGIARLPVEGDPDADKVMNELLTKLGRPMDHKGYKFEVPEGLEIDAERLETFSKLAHKIGLTKAQAAAIASDELAVIKSELEFQANHKKANAEVLRKEWGNAYDSNIKIAGSVLTKLSEKYPEQFQALSGTVHGSNPILFVLAAELGRATNETTSLGLQSGVSGGSTPEQAKNEINEILGNKHNLSAAYHDARNPAHSQAVEKMQSLFKDAYPEKSVDKTNS
jgi:hypothetical protein